MPEQDVTAVAAASAQAGETSMLPALPPVCVVLGWTHLVNDEKISAIGAYVRGDLSPRPADLAQIERSAAFGWEAAHRADTRRTSRKAIQCGVDLLAFCVVPLAGLVVYWAGGQVGRGLQVLSVIEALVVVGPAVQVVLYAGVFGPGRR
ncbi:hypothetical protein QF035_003605 [Streptomyces umbrinus]|uniref:Integral membrane protein n=1 Tax=Streptomyces umbrinus TaxID=67370 RepID=A0ABU0SR39_9ACTN|nr:hypothetical protein [Streptomyces umbrinus]MDQ1026023.1 hypothetical protein [Streptomyces umbrinus]